MGVELDKILGRMQIALQNPSKIMLFMRSMYQCGIGHKDPDVDRMVKWVYGDLPRIPITEVSPGIEDVDVTIMRAYDRVVGWSLDPEEILILCAIVKLTNARSVLEIGTYDGNTALNLAANSSADALITTLDLPPDWNGRFQFAVPGDHINVTDRSKTGEQFRNTKYSEKIIQVFGDSAKIDWGEMAVPFDIVFIDGCHYYDYVKKDTENALKYLKPSGILVWHDYGMIKDVSKVVDETAKKIEVRSIRGTRLAIGRKD